jgi:hypothetical protein
MSLHSPWKDLLAEPLPRDHVVQLYRDDRFLVEAVTLFAGVGIGKGEAILLIATAPQVASIELRLTALGFDVEGLKLWGQLTVFDAERLLSGFMVNGAPDRELFEAVVAQVIAQARAGGRYPRVRVYGEMVELLWRDNRAATRRLEELWNEVIETHCISLLCGYSLSSEEEADQFPRELRTLHSHLVPVEACAERPAISAGPPGTGLGGAGEAQGSLLAPLSGHPDDPAPRVE